MTDDITKKIKIQDLPRATALADTDLFPVVQGVEGNRTTRAVEASLIKSDSGASSLTELSDVAISSPTDGQVIKYDSSSDKWINADDEGGGTASDISYDNTTSGLSSINVQGAVDELAATLNTLKGLGLDYTYINIQSAEYTSGDLPVE